MPIDAASLRSKNMDAVQKVKNIPNCAAAPNIISFGFESSGPKSIIAPIPIKRISGNSSFDIPALNSVVSAPDSVSPFTSLSMAPEKGILTSIVPKPSGSSSVGSISYFIARKISSPPITHIVT